MEIPNFYGYIAMFVLHSLAESQRSPLPQNGQSSLEVAKELLAIALGQRCRFFLAQVIDRKVRRLEI